MATKSENPPSHTRSNRFSLGLSLKSQSSHRRGTDKQNEEDSEDWYIPYHGPYEKPKSSPVLRPRDSWGDLVQGYAGDPLLGDKAPNGRDEKHRDEFQLDDSDPDCDRTGSRRNRVLSGISHHTNSSGAVDPNRTGAGVIRRPVTSRANVPPYATSSYSTMDSARGVGESPMPPQRLNHYTPINVNNSNKASIANLFTFGGSSKKARPPSSNSNTGYNPDPSLSHSKPRFSLLRSNSSEGKREGSKLRRRRENNTAAEVHSRFPATTDEVYYDSYYTTLLTTPKDGDHFPVSFPQPHITTQPLLSSPRSQNPVRDEPSSINSHASPSSPTYKLAPHPYAHVFSSDRPSTAPSPITGHQLQDPGPSHQHHQKITLISPHPPLFPISGPTLNPPRQLKSSVSTPDFRMASRTRDPPQGLDTKPKATSKDRWLAIETWCDAIVFPRPRFQLKQGEKEKRPIISPPDTPIVSSTVHGDGGNGESVLTRNGKPGVQSRVLLHSRSHAELRPSTAETGSSSRPLISRRRGATLPNGTAKQSPFAEKTPVSNDGDTHLTRPNISTQDDAMSPSPVPSLTRRVVFCVSLLCRSTNTLPPEYSKKANS